jgi:hypothetical protein
MQKSNPLRSVTSVAARRVRGEVAGRTARDREIVRAAVSRLSAALPRVRKMQQVFLKFC